MLRWQGYGPVGKGGSTRGLSVHAVLAVDAASGALLGLAGAQIWNRTGGLVTARRDRRTADKESQRWLDGAEAAGRVLHAARQITVVADRESDIYEGFARRPGNVHLITRAAQDRAVESGERLFAHIDQLPEAGQFTTVIPAAPGRSPREQPARRQGVFLSGFPSPRFPGGNRLPRLRQSPSPPLRHQPLQPGSHPRNSSPHRHQQNRQ